MAALVTKKDELEFLSRWRNVNSPRDWGWSG